jgi:hypothetical protein
VKNKNFALLLISTLGVVGITTIGMTKNSLVTQQRAESEKRDERRGSIKWFVARAKEKNKTKLFVPPPEETYAEVTDLDDAVAHYSALLVEPIEQTTAVLNDSHIITWNKLKVIELLSYPREGCLQCAGGLSAPKEMLPLDASEILVPTSGGTLVVDGVQLESRDKDFAEPFSLSKTYLVFLSLDSTSGIGRLSLGPYGMFAVNVPDEIVPIIRGGAISRDLESKSRNSLIRFKDHLHKRSN